MHLQGGWTCQINTRGYFCNIQKVSAVHQSALAAYFRWQQLLDLSWTIQSLALFWYVLLQKENFLWSILLKKVFPFEIIGVILILCFKGSSQLTAHVPKVRGSHGVLGSTVSVNIWICALLFSWAGVWSQAVQRASWKGGPQLVWSFIYCVNFLLTATKISPSFPDTQLFPFLKLTCLKAALFPVVTGAGSHECGMHSLPQAERLRVTFPWLLLNLPMMFGELVWAYFPDSVSILVPDLMESWQQKWEAVEDVRSQMCFQGQNQELLASSREIMEITSETR